jgi:hypothetical protein
MSGSMVDVLLTGGFPWMYLFWCESKVRYAHFTVKVKTSAVVCAHDVRSSMTSCSPKPGFLSFATKSLIGDLPHGTAHH